MRLTGISYALPTALALAVAIATPLANQPLRADVYDLVDIPGAQGQQQQPIAKPPPLTLTRTVTSTQTFFEVVETVYMTKSALVPVSTPSAAKVDDKVENVCDGVKGITCDICRHIHECTDYRKECVACDKSPECEACWPPLSQRPEQPPLVRLGSTCSLGPGRTVPCELVNKGDGRGPVYRFGEEGKLQVVREAQEREVGEL